MSEQDLFCYPAPEEQKRLLQAMLNNPELNRKIGGTAIGGSDDYFTKTQPVEHIDQLKLFEQTND